MPKRVEVRDGIALSECGDTLLVLWKAPASLERWRYHVSRIEAMAASRVEGILCIDLILSESTPPDATVRKQMQADFRRMGAKLRRFVVVPLGDSIWLNVVRTIVRGVLLLSGQSERQRVAATVRQGIEQVLAAAGPETPTLAALEAEAALLFAELGVELRRIA